MQTKIDDFRGPYRWLSNFQESRVHYAGVGFPTVEHAYVAAKQHTWENFRNVLLCTTPREVKNYGRTVKLRDDWDYIKLLIMNDLIREKFHIHEELREKLILTGGAYLEEGNTWNDTYWGVCNGVGENNLGKILMKTREEIVFRKWLEARPDWISGKPDWMSWQ